ncbi:MAG: DUF2798 domain-containing protein [Sphingobacterium sp.]
MISTFLVVLPTTFLMAIISSIRNDNAPDNRILVLVEAWIISLPIVYACVLFFLPIAHKMASKLLEKK